jgi:hypothetical protein
MKVWSNFSCYLILFRLECSLSQRINDFFNNVADAYHLSDYVTVQIHASFYVTFVFIDQLNALTEEVNQLETIKNNPIRNKYDVYSKNRELVIIMYLSL